MKKSIYKIAMIVCLTISSISCSQSEEKINSEIISYFNNNAKDPKSYEFIELKVTDTITVNECANSIYKNNTEFIEYCKNSIVEYEAKITKIKREVQEAKSLEYVDLELLKKVIASSDESTNRKIERINSLKTQITNGEKQNLELSKYSKNTDVISYVYWHKYRLKNSFGALDLFESYFTLDKDYLLINKSEDILEPQTSANKKFKELYLNNKETN